MLPSLNNGFVVVVVVDIMDDRTEQPIQYLQLGGLWEQHVHLVQQQGPVRGSNCGKPQLMTNTGFTFNVQTHPTQWKDYLAMHSSAQRLLLQSYLELAGMITCITC